jgi:hypothetical protein
MLDVYAHTLKTAVLADSQPTHSAIPARTGRNPFRRLVRTLVTRPGHMTDHPITSVRPATGA